MKVKERKLHWMFRYLGALGLTLNAFDPDDKDAKAAIKAAVEEATADLKEQLKSAAKGKVPDLDDQIQAAVEEATKALAANNKKLKGELQEARKGAEIDPAVHEKALQRIEELEGVNAKLTTDLKKTGSELQKAQKTIADETGFTSKLLIDNGLNDALVAAGVSNPAHLKGATALLRGQVQVVTEGDTRTAKFGDKALKDFVKEWVGGDEGKHYVTAKANGGGGAGGSGGGSGAADPNLSKLPPVERINAAREAQAGKGGGRPGT